jgi:hypothetical protein
VGLGGGGDSGIEAGDGLVECVDVASRPATSTPWLASSKRLASACWSCRSSARSRIGELGQLASVSTLRTSRSTIAARTTALPKISPQPEKGCCW